ncbi:MAG TPA: TatD family hydrolase [Acidimicrobiia bacterium]|nr:TatD family hydrolase [Acidimicrobiia bacterium]
MTWIDSHCHLPSLSGPPDEALVRARAAGVEAVISIGTDLESSRRGLELADRHPDVWATVGLHPHEAAKLAVEWGQLLPLTAAERTVGIGETGLDYFYEHSPRDEQIIAFRAQVRLAHERELPLVVHARDAWDDTFAVLAEEGTPARTIVHCFTGGEREAERALALGAVLSFSGIVSFKNAHDVREAARITPSDRMLVETDAPYLAPVPHRGRENEPAWVVDVGVAIAAATDRTVEDVADSTRSVARTLFRI